MVGDTEHCYGLSYTYRVLYNWKGETGSHITACIAKIELYEA